MEVQIIAIAGGSCSGKTTLAQAVYEQLGEDNCLLILQDNYYRGLEGITNFDVPEAIDFALLAKQLSDLRAGRTIHMPTYDFTTHRRKPEVVELTARPVVLVDGILILHAAELQQSFDFKVFVACDEATRRQRRLARDVRERGREYEATLQQFNEQTAPMHDRYVEPSKGNADLIHQSHADTVSLLQYCFASI
ncbi:uridine kinase [Microbulbifer bruguierae]|uniref:uridine/cytidine kinase n=1 Tax=Microbulbifer bruguierae TaxID=3029061 RepID=A0ABY8NEG1_9GAMM|nr:uridine kinase [Microbulbifer bruguierae]WGL17188.1 uridine kinase [Microbulbifer bruguierae]